MNLKFLFFGHLLILWTDKKAIKAFDAAKTFFAESRVKVDAVVSVKLQHIYRLALYERKDNVYCREKTILLLLYVIYKAFKYI